MCCRGAKWKREVVQDHKFDFVDIHEYHTNGLWTRFRYFLCYVFVIKSFLVYISDIYTVITMMAKDYWAGNILSESGDSNAIKVPFTIGRWIFLGCIIFSFLLLAWESRKARMIIKSRDISYAFTNVMANNYYTLKSYDHFCFFSQIDNSKKKKDEFAFFVFFTFKGWKRLLLADAPRQVINSLTLYSFGKAFNFTTDLSKYYNNSDGEFSLVRAGVLCTMIFTVVIWCGSAILLAIAALMYIPLLCYIQGNLKEYCCHKIDKRIAELMKRKTKKRLAREAELAKREATGDYRHLQDKKGNFKNGQVPLPQPTLPTIDLKGDDEFSQVGKGDSYKKAYGNNHYPPTNQVSYANHPQYGHGQEEYEYGYPSNNQFPPAHFNQYPSNKSTVSFGMDDKASIKSRDPLMYYQQPYNGGYMQEHDPYSQYQLDNDSMADLNRAPSYRTRENEEDIGVPGNGSVYDFRQQQYAPLDRGDYFSQGGGQQHSEPPYVQSRYQPSSNAGHSDHDSYTPRVQSPLQYSSDPNQPQLRPVNFEPSSTPYNPNARGVSIAGRSDITTFYNIEDRDRQSIADSSIGNFDLDDYARASMVNPQLHSQQQNRGSRLDYLEEGDEEEYLRQQQRQPYGNQTQNHYPSHFQHRDQQDWGR